MALGARLDSDALRIAEQNFRELLQRIEPGRLVGVERDIFHDSRTPYCRATFENLPETVCWRLPYRPRHINERWPTQGEYQVTYEVARIERRGQLEIDAIEQTIVRIHSYATMGPIDPAFLTATAQADMMINDVRARIEREIEQMLYGGNRRYFFGADLARDAQTNNVPAPPQTMTVADLTAAMQQFPQPPEHDDIIRCYATTMAPLPALHQRDYAPYQAGIGGLAPHQCCTGAIATVYAERDYGPIEHVIDYIRERARLATERRAKAEVKATALLKSWLSPAQLADFLKTGRFWVTGSAGNLYRIRGDVPSYNVEFCDKHGNYRTTMCFYPQGAPAMGDMMLAQKLTLETDEYEAHAIANLNSPELRLVRPGAVMTTLRAGLPRRSFYEMVFEHLGF